MVLTFQLAMRSAGDFFCAFFLLPGAEFFGQLFEKVL